MGRLVAAVWGTSLVLVSVALAGGPVGDLAERDCTSGETQSDSACDQIASAAPNGEGSGLFGVESVTVGKRGRFVYAAARQDHSIARFRRAANGSLSYRGCLSGQTTTSCGHIPAASSNGAGSGLADVRALVVTRDGKNAYAAVAGDDAVAQFKIGRRGKLRYRGCIGGDSDAACRDIPRANPGGEDTGLDHPKSLTISRNGKSLYIAGTNDASIMRFRRIRRSGRLRFGGCITGEIASGPAGSGACRATPNAGIEGDGSGLDDARGLALSPDQKWLYGVSSDDDAVFRFKRSRRTGRLAFRGCLTGETQSDAPCALAPGADSQGGNSGFDDLRALAITGDGKSVYVTSRGDDAVVELRRGLRRGTLTYRRCLSGELESAAGEPCDSTPDASADGHNSGMDAAEAVVASRDGRSVYVSTTDDDAVVELRRSRATGRLTFRTCDSGDIATGPNGGSGACSELTVVAIQGFNTGIDFPQFMALSRDDRSLYVAAAADHSVFHFRRNR